MATITANKSKVNENSTTKPIARSAAETKTKAKTGAAKDLSDYLKMR